MRLKTLSKYRPLCGYRAVAKGLALFATKLDKKILIEKGLGVIK